MNPSCHLSDDLEDDPAQVAVDRLAERFGAPTDQTSSASWMARYRLADTGDTLLAVTLGRLSDQHIRTAVGTTERMLEYWRLTGLTAAELVVAPAGGLVDFADRDGLQAITADVRDGRILHVVHQSATAISRSLACGLRYVAALRDAGAMLHLLEMGGAVNDLRLAGHEFDPFAAGDLEDPAP